MPRPRSSRRASGLKDGDFDHEIDLVDRDDENTGSPRPLSPEPPDTFSHLETATTPSLSNRDDSLSAHLLAHRQEGNEDNHQAALQESREGLAVLGQDATSTRPSIEIHAPSLHAHPSYQIRTHANNDPRDAVVDILYENERGCIVCGRAFFSSKALGGLDPSPWTNSFHKTSPTDMKTAQVPDPSWEWAWPEWRVNEEKDTDAGGWKYSFMFQKRFSWHGPHWWNSFVRRRTWIRKRVKRQPDGAARGPNMLNTDYFTVQSASERSRSLSLSVSHSRSASAAGSYLGSRASIGQLSQGGTAVSEEPGDIEDVETLLLVLRRARIDREKIEAVENYLEHTSDALSGLQGAVHDIMGILVFQNSRRLLLAQLNRTLDSTTAALEKDDSALLRQRKDNLEAAIVHADEEVRKLAYWSDVKALEDSGEPTGAVEDPKSPDDTGEGADGAGPSDPKPSI